MAHFTYGGDTYEVRDEDIAGLQKLIVQKADSGKHAWIKVRAAAGGIVEILVGPGSEISVYKEPRP